MDIKRKRPPITIPKYSLSEELLNSISHGFGGLFGIIALVLCVVRAASSGPALTIFAAALYGATLIVLYTMSTIYHALRVNKAKRVFRVIDHCSIFLLIAGTYTPFTLITLRGAVGWWLFAGVWTAAAIGIALNAIDLKKFSPISTVCYVAMGWVVVFAFGPLKEALAPAGIALLIWGGVAYTVGAVLYAIGSKKKYFHSVFHFFVLAGSVLHFLSVYMYVL